MADPQLENTGVTHTYVARAWYKDTATWFNLGSFAFLLLQESEFVKLIPIAWHPATTAFVIAFNLWIRFNSSTRPVALTEGKPVQVQSIEPKATEKGSVSDSTRSRFLPLILLALLMLGCASAGGPRHVAVISVVSAHAVLSAVQDTERTLVCGVPTAPTPPACVPPDVHQKISADLVTAFDLDGRVARLMRAMTPGGVLPADYASLLGQIAGIVDRVIALIPTSAPKAQLVAQIGGVQ